MVCNPGIFLPTDPRVLHVCNWYHPRDQWGVCMQAESPLGQVPTKMVRDSRFSRLGLRYVACVSVASVVADSSFDAFAAFSKRA